jgi:hypothetical protein
MLRRMIGDEQGPTFVKKRFFPEALVAKVRDALTYVVRPWTIGTISVVFGRSVLRGRVTPRGPLTIRVAAFGGWSVLNTSSASRYSFTSSR